MASNEQMIIIYEDPLSHQIKKYTTAYNQDQEQFYIKKCLAKFGMKIGARSVPAKNLTA